MNLNEMTNSNSRTICDPTFIYRRLYIANIKRDPRQSSEERHRNEWGSFVVMRCVISNLTGELITSSYKKKCFHVLATIQSQASLINFYLTAFARSFNAFI
jgi:hypothetical protein